MIRAFVVAAIAAGLAAAPAAAVTYDAFSSFNGTQGAGNFTYGITDGTTFTPFAVSTNCFISGSTCLQLAANFDVPGVTKSSAPSFQYGSVNVPTDRLLLHPGNSDSQSTYVMFTVPTAGFYTLSATANVQDINPSGVGVTAFTSIGGSPFLFPFGILSSSNPSIFIPGSGSLSAGDTVTLIFDRDGDYSNDSTGLNFKMTTGAVPEPESWALMISGFGLVGAAMRRRAAVAA